MFVRYDGNWASGNRGFPFKMIYEGIFFYETLPNHQNAGFQSQLEK